MLFNYNYLMIFSYVIIFIYFFINFKHIEDPLYYYNNSFINYKKIHGIIIIIFGILARFILMI